MVPNWKQVIRCEYILSDPFPCRNFPRRPISYRYFHSGLSVTPIKENLVNGNLGGGGETGIKTLEVSVTRNAFV